VISERLKTALLSAGISIVTLGASIVQNYLKQPETMTVIGAIIIAAGATLVASAVVLLIRQVEERLKTVIKQAK